MRRISPWIASALIALFAVPALATGKSDPSPETDGAFVVYDEGFRDATGPTDDTVVDITTGGKVRFGYLDGKETHNVIWQASGPTSCDPPLPTAPEGPGWDGHLHLQHSRDVRVLLPGAPVHDRHGQRHGHRLAVAFPVTVAERVRIAVALAFAVADRDRERHADRPGLRGQGREHQRLQVAGRFPGRRHRLERDGDGRLEGQLLLPGRRRHGPQRGVQDRPVTDDVRADQDEQRAEHHSRAAAARLRVHRGLGGQLHLRRAGDVHVRL